TGLGNPVNIMFQKSNVAGLQSFKRHFSMPAARRVQLGNRNPPGTGRVRKSGRERSFKRFHRLVQRVIDIKKHSFNHVYDPSHSSLGSGAFPLIGRALVRPSFAPPVMNGRYAEPVPVFHLPVIGGTPNLSPCPNRVSFRDGVQGAASSLDGFLRSAFTV